MTVIIPQGDTGLPVYETEDYKVVELFTGTTPKNTTSEKVAAAAIAAADLPAYSVVGRDGSGELVMAVNGSVNAIGITVSPVLMAAADRDVEIFRDGVFNPAALTWDASYATDEDKRLAFEAAGVGIFIQKPKYQG